MNNSTPIRVTQHDHYGKLRLIENMSSTSQLSIDFLPIDKWEPLFKFPWEQAQIFRVP